ncbi:hypothetical protein PQR70_14055 [Paraburkholderia madseniana]|uniref:hypothetical protein n=1 Tax=Paraburkholderia madseniana TaxID=2599607 RepID=UPI0038B7AB21
MKLNGWIRLWTVGSVVWILFVGYLAYDPLALLYGKKTYDATKEGLGTSSFVFSAAQTESEARSYLGSTLIPAVERDPQRYIGKTDQTPYARFVGEHAPALILKYVELALGPVAVVLALGWAIKWVRSGFKRQSSPR